MWSAILSPDFFSAILRSATPILFATLAAGIAAKSGITNMALEGILLFSALFGVIFSSLTQSAWLGLIITVVIGGLIGLVLAFFILNLKTDEILAAIAINLAATGGTVLIMLYFSGDDLEIAGASPETLVKVTDQSVRTFPLAGTRPRGKTPQEDLELERELLSDEKELAEHNMLVDLGRNDLGKISRFGTVAVDKYLSVEKFSHVMHIGSEVQGELRQEFTAVDAVDAVLPAGTLSGAPKIRACEIIHELEERNRGIYGGAIGYLDFTGNMDTCISIRLAYKKNGKVYVCSGAGIVADSVPEKEYEECRNKAQAVIQALKCGMDSERKDSRKKGKGR